MESKLNRKILIQGLFGNILEWYDFALYGYFASKISTLFFPSDSLFKSMIMTYIVFAIGLFMRPLGGILFGYLGDKYGRIKSLIYSIFLMAVPTCVIGILPTYDSIGIWSSIILTLCRFFQGIAVGGEFTCSMVYIIEYSPPDRRGLYGSCIMLSAFVGILLGSGICALVDFVSSGSTASDWAWRIPFISGLLLFLVGYYYRRTMPETPEFKKIVKESIHQKSPIKEVFLKHPKIVLLSTLLVMLPAMSFYLIFVYLPTYIENYLKVSLFSSLAMNSISMLLLILAVPIFGFISDIFGRKLVMLLGTLGFVVLSYPLFLLLFKGTSTLILFSQCIFAILIAMIYSAIPATLFEMFDTSIRCTAVSIPYNIANSLFGGTAPLISTILIHYCGNLGPCIYLIVIAIIALPGIIFLRKGTIPHLYSK